MVQDHTVKPGGPGNVVRSGVEEELKENLKQEKYFYTKIRSHQILTNTECVCVKGNKMKQTLHSVSNLPGPVGALWYFTGTLLVLSTSPVETPASHLSLHTFLKKKIYFVGFFSQLSACLCLVTAPITLLLCDWVCVCVKGGCIRGWGLHGPCAWESLCTTVATGQAVMAEAPSLHPFLPLLLTPQPLSMAAFVCAKYHTAD